MGKYEDNIVPIKIAQLAEFVSKVKRSYSPLTA